MPEKRERNESKDNKNCNKGKEYKIMLKRYTAKSFWRNEITRFGNERKDENSNVRKTRFVKETRRKRKKAEN